MLLSEQTIRTSNLVNTLVTYEGHGMAQF